MNAINFIFKNFATYALPEQLEIENVISNSATFKENTSPEELAKKKHKKMIDLGYLLDADSKTYKRNLTELEVVQTAFSSTLPFWDTDENGELIASKPKRFCPSGGFSYLIISEAGYWGHYILGSKLGNRLGYELSLYHPRFLETSALPRFIKTWDGKPFVVLALDDTAMDFRNARITYDLRHVVINDATQPYVRDLSFITELDLTQKPKKPKKLKKGETT